jgi:hypothetical protein
MVTEDYIGGGENVLSASKGHYVRPAKAPASVDIPEGFKYLMASNGKEKRLIPEDLLLKIELDPMASTNVTKHTENLEDGELHVNDNPRPFAKQLKKQRLGGGEKVNLRGGETPGIPVPLLPLKVYRAVEGSDKIGNSVKDSFIGKCDKSFHVENGHFLLVDPNLSESSTQLKTIVGEIGEVKSRRLQLLESPWGFPNALPLLPNDNEKFEALNAEEMREAARVRGVEHSGSRADIFKGLKDWSATAFVPIPLMHLNMAYSAEEAQSETNFEKGEIVRYFHGSEDEETQTVEIQDYESLRGRVRLQDLETIGEEISGRDHPFGVRLIRSQLKRKSLVGENGRGPQTMKCEKKSVQETQASQGASRKRSGNFELDIEEKEEKTPPKKARLGT